MGAAQAASWQRRTRRARARSCARAATSWRLAAGRPAAPAGCSAAASWRATTGSPTARPTRGAAWPWPASWTSAPPQKRHCVIGEESESTQADAEGSLLAVRAGRYCVCNELCCKMLKLYAPDWQVSRPRHRDAGCGAGGGEARATRAAAHGAPAPQHRAARQRQPQPAAQCAVLTVGLLLCCTQCMWQPEHRTERSQQPATHP